MTVYSIFIVYVVLPKTLQTLCFSESIHHRSTRPLGSSWPLGANPRRPTWPSSGACPWRSPFRRRGPPDPTRCWLIVLAQNDGKKGTLFKAIISNQNELQTFPIIPINNWVDDFESEDVQHNILKGHFIRMMVFDQYIYFGVGVPYRRSSHCYQTVITTLAIADGTWFWWGSQS